MQENNQIKRYLSINAKYIIDRVKSIFNVKTDLELAEILNIKSNSISSWRSRNSVNYDLIFRFCDNINLNWLINGIGEMYLVEKHLVGNNKVSESQIKYNAEKEQEEVILRLEVDDNNYTDIKLSIFKPKGDEL